MPSTYTELYYHFIWATKGREPLITPEMERRLYRYIRKRSEEMRVLVHALDGDVDHSHLAASLPTSLAIADLLETTKGASSHLVNHLPDPEWRLYWQEGYGALTFSKRDLPVVVAYISNQKRHHAERTLRPKLERACSED